MYSRSYGGGEYASDVILSFWASSELLRLICWFNCEYISFYDSNSIYMFVFLSFGSNCIIEYGCIFGLELHENYPHSICFSGVQDVDRLSGS
jgi:hypothetical protein